MSIVTNRGPRRKRPRPVAQPVEIDAPRIVRVTPKGRAWRSKPLPDDPEADARIAEFFARMVRPG